MARFNWSSISGKPDVLREVKLERKKERVEKKMRRQYMLASDGKVYFVEDGLLQVLDTMEEYKKLIALNDKKASTYFEVVVGTAYYKHLMVDRDGVFKILATIKNIETRIQETARYLKEKEEAGL